MGAVKVLVTGATGYIGGRLIPLLLQQGHRVRILVRDLNRVANRPWLSDVEIVVGDLLSGTGIASAANGIDAAYYLVHSMAAGPDFAEHDRRAARNFTAAARGIRHVIYLGGLLPAGNNVSEHLASRREVGTILAAALPVTELRAGPIIGSGSASFELLRYLVNRLPLIPTPQWLHHTIQPIAIRDILSYLVGVLDQPPLGILEVGADKLAFRDMLAAIAEINNLRRWFIPSPLPTSRQAGIIAGLITPLPRHLALPLVMSVDHPLVADTRRAGSLFPRIHPITYRRAVQLAIGKIQRGEVETSWSNALGEGPTYRLSDWEGMIREERSLYIKAPPEAVYRSFSSLGGDRGWLVWNWAWRLRGALDKMIGGPGLRRGRRHPLEVLPGETIDFWRVEDVTVPQLLRLRAEMLVPGRAWLQWEARAEGNGTRLMQTALFAPRGLGGTAYWYVLYPVHRLIFSDLVRAIAADSLHFTIEPETGGAS